MDPEMILEYTGRSAMVRQRKTKKRMNGDFLNLVQQLLKPYHLVRHPSLPPLVGGFVGYIGYELVQQFETIKLKKKKGLPVPDAVLFFPVNLVVFDHIKHQVKLIHLATIKGSVKHAYVSAVAEIKKMLSRLNRSVHDHKVLSSENIGRKLHRQTLRSNVARSRFESMVRKSKEYIRAGDCIQVVISQRFDLGVVSNDFELYRALRSLNPSPYMFYFKNRKMTLVGSSPEMLTKKMGTTAEVCPIAGTRPRGTTNAEDIAFENALRSSPKEMAEHLMLVDLGRNDLGRVCEPATVRVNDFARIERYSHVMHLVSDVQAVLKKGRTAFDLLRATFPAGTVTGAPKIRAMQIIDELEPERRGPYAGALGYFGISGDMDMCITIRTMIVFNNHASVQAGAGIVNDSIPKNEYRETVNKAKALLQAVNMCKDQKYDLNDR